MKIYFKTPLTLLLLSVMVLSFTGVNTSKADLDSLWKQATEYENEGKPKSALEVTEQIYELAKQQKAYDHQVKAVMYMLRYKQQFDEMPYQQMIDFINGELKTAKSPLYQLLQAVEGEMYLNYYRNNQYLINQKPVLTAAIPEALIEWDAGMFEKMINKALNESLVKPKDLLKIPVEDYYLILSKGDAPAIYRPTLFDILAHRAIDFYEQKNVFLPEPENEVIIDHDSLFVPASDFINFKLSEKDTGSGVYKALQLYRQLLQVHQTGNDAYNLIDLERIELIYNNCVSDTKESAYLSYLDHFEKKHQEEEITAEAMYKKAMLYYSGYKSEEDSLATKKLALLECEDAQKKFPKSYGAQHCTALKSRIEEKYLNANMEKTLLPDQNNMFLLKYRNINTVYFKIISLSKTDMDEMERKRWQNNYLYNLLKKRDGIENKELVLPLPGDYVTHSIEIPFEALPLGHYALVISSSPNFVKNGEAFEYGFFQVSKLMLVKETRYYDNEKTWYHVMDAETGNSVQDAKIKISKTINRQEIIVKELLTPKDGKFFVNGNANNYIKIKVTKGEDSWQEGGWVEYYNQAEKDHLTTYLFTDRAIYRPGQKVYFKGVVVKRNFQNGLYQIQPGYTTQIQFLDANYKKIGEMVVVANEFGSYNGSFDIPKGLMTGTFRIQEQSGTVQFQVEEYKRPKFYLKMDSLTSTYLPGDRITLTGQAKTYSEIGLSNASFSYEVVRKVSYPYWYRWYIPFFQESEKIISHGKGTTTDEGRFSFETILKPDPKQKNSQYAVFTFRILVVVTDQNGETHQVEKWVSTSNNPLDGELVADEYHNLRKNINIRISTKNLEGQEVETAGKLVIKKIEPGNRLLRKKLWESPGQFLLTSKEYSKQFPHDIYSVDTAYTQKEIYSTNINSNLTVEIPVKNLDNFEQGKYEIYYKGKDSNGNHIELKKTMTVYNAESKKAALHAYSFVIPVKTIVEPGEKAIFAWGSAAQNAFALIRAYQRTRLLYAAEKNISNGQLKIEIPVTEAERGGFSVSVLCVQNNRVYENTFKVTVPWNNKKLDISLSTFRSNIEPGKKESWTVHIKQPDGNNANAELLAAMYDASLNAILPHGWAFSPFFSFGAVDAFSTGNRFSRLSTSSLSSNWNSYFYASNRTFDRMNFFDLGYGYYPYLRGNVMMDAVRVKEYKKPLFRKDENEDKAMMISDDEFDFAPSPATEQVKKEVSIRKNFNETAFFFPALTTDKNGDVDISFEVPEALTRWKLMLLAYSKELEFAYETKEVVTAKQLMLTTNNPRFLRTGDYLEYSVNLSNKTNGNLNGTVKLEILDLLADSASYAGISINKPRTDFSLESNKTQNISWKVRINKDANPGIMVFRVVAQSGDVSDGEENAIPLLSDKIMVTESMPLYIRKGQTKTFKFDKLLQSGDDSLIINHNLCLEMTPNPAWYALMSLPYLMEFPYECNEQLFNRFYANSITHYLLENNEVFKKMISRWENSGSPVSNLYKNEELKNISLQESPWLMAAKSETDDFKKLATLISDEDPGIAVTQILNKLTANQNPDGGWSWFSGMRSNLFITQYILTGFGRLQKMKVIDLTGNEDMQNMITKAILYIDKEQKKIYTYLLRQKGIDMGKDHLGYTSIQYLYLRSFFTDQTFSIGSKIMFEYWKGQAKKYWLSKGLLGKGMIAVALSRYSEQPTALKILESLDEYALHSEELGMYWKANTASYYWYNAPVETQSQLVEAYLEVRNDTAAADEMRIWLLKQKQVQRWESTKATADACYALLVSGTSWLHEGTGVKLWIGDKEIDFTKLNPEAGTSYIKKSWTPDEIEASMGNITLTKQDDGIAWGALHWQYFAPMSHISPHKTPIIVEKRLSVSEKTSKGEQFTEIRPGDNIKVGDKLISRITINVDRDMEFVHLKDMRGGCFEPFQALSGYRYSGGLGYYQSIKDASVNFFFDYLPKGTYVLKYEMFATQKGSFENGIAEIQSMYAPEFNSHSASIKVEVR